MVGIMVINDDMFFMMIVNIVLKDENPMLEMRLAHGANDW